MSILWKMIFWNCDFCDKLVTDICFCYKCDFEIVNFLKPVILNMRNFWINVDFCPSVRCREKALTLLKLASDSGRRRPSSRFALLVTQTLPKFIWEEELLVLLHILNWYFWFDCKKEQTVIEVGPFFLMLGRKLLQQLGKQGGIREEITKYYSAHC